MKGITTFPPIKGKKMRIITTYYNDECGQQLRTNNEAFINNNNLDKLQVNSNSFAYQIKKIRAY